MQGIAKLLVTIGVMLVLVGLCLRLFGGRLGWLGHLPGDIRIGNSVYIPLTSCLLVSLVLTVVLNLLRRFFWR